MDCGLLYCSQAAVSELHLPGCDYFDFISASLSEFKMNTTEDSSEKTVYCYV